MKIDLRYAIPVVAFFVPTLLLKFLLWFWEVEQINEEGALFFSIIAGICSVTVGGIIVIWTEPIIYHIGSKPNHTGRGE